MRVTERGLLQLAARGSEAARTRLARAAQAASSGVRVDRPSVDVAAWVTSRRAAADKIGADARGKAIGAAQDRLAAMERSVTDVQEMLTRTRELGIQLTTATMSAREREFGAAELRSLRAAALAALNARDVDGAFLFAGAANGSAPFDASGLYQGSTEVRRVELGPGWLGATEVTADQLDAPQGGLFATIDAMITGLDANDPVAVRAQLDPVTALIDRATLVRGAIGERARALGEADDARRELADALVLRRDESIGADMVGSATELVDAKSTLENAQTVAQQLVSLLKQG
jgi:flagellar hook-associated protein 3 FlgL